MHLAINISHSWDHYLKYKSRFTKQARSNTCPKALWAGYLSSLSPVAQFGDELLCSPGRADAKFHQLDQAAGAILSSLHPSARLLLSFSQAPSLHFVSWQKQGKAQEQHWGFKYQPWNFSHQPSKHLTAYTKQNSFSEESEKHLWWYVLQISKAGRLLRTRA